MWKERGKVERDQADCWSSEAFGEARKSSGINLFSMFSYVGSGRKSLRESGQCMLRFNMQSLRYLAVSHWISSKSQILLRLDVRHDISDFSKMPLVAPDWLIGTAQAPRSASIG